MRILKFFVATGLSVCMFAACEKNSDGELNLAYFNIEIPEISNSLSSDDIDEIADANLLQYQYGYPAAVYNPDGFVISLPYPVSSALLMPAEDYFSAILYGVTVDDPRASVYGIDSFSTYKNGIETENKLSCHREFHFFTNCGGTQFVYDENGRIVRDGHVRRWTLPCGYVAVKFIYADRDVKVTYLLEGNIDEYVINLKKGWNIKYQEDRNMDSESDEELLGNGRYLIYDFDDVNNPYWNDVYNCRNMEIWEFRK